MIFDVSAPNNGIVTADKSLDLTQKVIQQLKVGQLVACRLASLTAQAVADLVGGRLLGDGAVAIRTVRPLDQAGPDALSLAVSARYAGELATSGAGAVLVPEALATVAAGPRARIVVPDPYGALVRVLRALYPDDPAAPGIDPTRPHRSRHDARRRRDHRRRSWCWGGTYGSAPAAGWPSTSPSKTGSSWARTASSVRVPSATAAAASATGWC